jgi:hypothetical protein
MHGLASNILEGTCLADHLLPVTALFCFDFSGSGKSAGTVSSYGLKEQDDIRAVLEMLQAEGYRKFILWGRSMGAVACLLHEFSRKEKEGVVMQVVDSPFSSFESVCQLYACKFMGIPQLLVSPALGVLKESLSNHAFSPFQIDLLSGTGRCSTPTLFVYSEQDDVIPASNSEAIIRTLADSCYYERLIIPDEHNHVRSASSLAAIFQKIHKFIRLFEKDKDRPRRKGFDVYSSFVKRSTAKEGEDREKRETFRRSAIYCSLSKKHSSFFSPKLSKKKSDLNP